MKALLQRVNSAKVEIDGKIKSQIETGLLVFVAFKENDSETELEWMARKIIQIRIFNDTEGKLNLSVRDVNGGILIVSQFTPLEVPNGLGQNLNDELMSDLILKLLTGFTLYADGRKGNRPSFDESAPPAISRPLYEKFSDIVKKEFNGKVENGEFGADMKVSLLNDGPVTIILEK